MLAYINRTPRIDCQIQENMNYVTTLARLVNGQGHFLNEVWSKFSPFSIAKSTVASRMPDLPWCCSLV